MNTIEAATSPSTLSQALKTRYAVKKFEKGRAIPKERWAALEESLLLAPSSGGLQPWKFFVVEDPALRARLQPASWGQSQIVDADKLVIFAARKGFAAPDVLRFIARVAKVRGVPPASLDGYRDMMLGIVARPPEAVDAWAARQVYIALGTFLTGAALLGVDACPMEGFEPAKYDEILGLAEKGYTAVVVATAGYRSPQDTYAGLAKVRYEADQVVETL